MSEEEKLEFVDMTKIKNLIDLQKEAQFSAVKAENDQLKLKLCQLEIKATYHLSDTDLIDTATGIITRK